MKHVLALGFQEEDAPLLYENKEQWVGVQLDSKLKCVQQGCKFETDMFPSCLDEHCQTIHGWKEYPCKQPNCNWVSYSSTSYKIHLNNFHQPWRKIKIFPWKCEITGCDASFDRKFLLRLHMNVHENISYDCQFCPYRCATKNNFFNHLNSHFENRSFKCELCDKSFITNGCLTEHIENVHEAIQYQCPLCNYTSKIKSVRDHLSKTHQVKYFLDRTKKQFVIVK